MLGRLISLGPLDHEPLFFAALGLFVSHGAHSDRSESGRELVARADAPCDFAEGTSSDHVRGLLDAHRVTHGAIGADDADTGT